MNWPLILGLAGLLIGSFVSAQHLPAAVEALLKRHEESEK